MHYLDLWSFASTNMQFIFCKICPQIKAIVDSKMFKLSGLLKCASAAILLSPAILRYQLCVRFFLKQAKGCSE